MAVDLWALLSVWVYVTDAVDRDVVSANSEGFVRAFSGLPCCVWDCEALPPPGMYDAENSTSRGET